MNILARLQEPSTYAGIAAFVMILSPSLANIITEAGVFVAQIAAGAAALFAMFKKDPGSVE